MSDGIDIKGMWAGSYSYSATAEMGATAFKARFSESSDGAVKGIAIEEDEISGGEIKSDLVGTREGRELRMTKRYIGGGEHYRREVEYEGEISADGQSIQGRWMLPDDSGTFEMRRS